MFKTSPEDYMESLSCEMQTLSYIRNNDKNDISEKQYWTYLTVACLFIPFWFLLFQWDI